MGPHAVNRALAIIVSFAFFLELGQCGAQSEITLPVAAVFTGCSNGRFSSGSVITQCSKAGAGAGIEYRHWWANEGAAISYMGSATSSKLIAPSGKFFEYPITRNEFDLMFVQRFAAPLRWRVSPDLRAGVAAIILNGGHWSGLDRQFAAVVGASADIRLSRRLSLELGSNYNSLTASTYSDQTYKSSRTYMWEPRAALVMQLGSTKTR